MTKQFKYDDASTKWLSPHTRQAISEQIKEDIDQWCVDNLTDDLRNHLGASIIGHDCKAYAWFVFRWVKKEIFEGRMLRLFDRGHLEEERIIKWLRAIGVKVWEVEPEILHYHPESDSYWLAKEFNIGDGLVMDATDMPEHEKEAANRGIKRKQFRIWACGGHYGGSLDSKGILPYLPDLPILLEFKTHNYKSFSNLISKGVALGKPRHYAQMCSYGKHYGFKYGLYFAVNKNDDDIWPELVELNWNLSDELIQKAEDVITSKGRPARISEHSSYFECKYCPFMGPCHFQEPADKNCRSCRNATPVDNAEWYCEHFKSNIPKEFLIKGCPNHVSIIGQ